MVSGVNVDGMVKLSDMVWVLSVTTKEMVSGIYRIWDLGNDTMKNNCVSTLKALTIYSLSLIRSLGFEICSRITQLKREKYEY